MGPLVIFHHVEFVLAVIFKIQKFPKWFTRVTAKKSRDRLLVETRDTICLIRAGRLNIFSLIIFAYLTLLCFMHLHANDLFPML
jgi:hypothetical protein